MKIWVDTPTGTWGCIEDLVVIEVDEIEIDEIADWSDSERSDWATYNGVPVELT